MAAFQTQQVLAIIKAKFGENSIFNVKLHGKTKWILSSMVFFAVV